MTRRATRTRLLAAAALVLSSGGLAACGGDGGSGDDGDGTVTIWASVDQPIVDGFQEHLDAAAKDAGLTVNLEKVENINQLIMTKIQANDTPDIALIPQPGVVGDMIKPRRGLPARRRRRRRCALRDDDPGHARRRDLRRPALRPARADERQEPRLLQQGRVRGSRLRAPAVDRRPERPHRADQVRRRHAVVHGHRGRHRDGLASHRLVRGPRDALRRCRR